MKIDDIPTADAEQLAPVLLAALQRAGELGRGAFAELAKLVDDGDVNFDEAADFIGEISNGTFVS